MEGPAIGAAVGVACGGAWGVAGATGLKRPWNAWAAGLSIAISVLLVVALARNSSLGQAGTFRGSVYGVDVALEAAAILLTVLMLKRLSLLQFAAPAIGFIVGLHFLGLWKATDLSLFVWTAAAMCVISVLAALLPAGAQDSGFDRRRVVAGMGCAIVLWCAGLAVLF